MINCIFTLDYEIYGNGTGSLRELVYEPAKKLKAIFDKWNAHFVVFVEVAEVEMIEAQGSDPAIDLVKQQIRDFHEEGLELGLHLHPWWYNARYENGTWFVDYSEYNLCALPQERITQIIHRAIVYFREILGVADFTPLSYRAGHLLFQPTQPAAKVLAEQGIKLDSSVYRGGLWRQHNLDYRAALKNGYYWRFTDSINEPDTDGILLELPIYTRMVPFWRMISTKRVNVQRGGMTIAQAGRKKLSRIMDYLRFSYPLKFDLSEMTIKELTNMVDAIIHEDKKNPRSFKPIVAIGHTKDVDFKAIEVFLSYLKEKDVAVSNFEEVYHKCKH